jgi:uncharacterized protein YecE (DUF72 family)
VGGGLTDSSGRGQLLAGTSGFAYPAWAPRFYPPGVTARQLLEAYANRLPAVELNNTFYRRPSAAAVDGWLTQTPPHFRFCPKAQRGVAWRAWRGGPRREEGQELAMSSMAWLADSFRAFGDRLGCVLLSAPATARRDDVALARLLDARSPDLPLALDLPHPSWAADEVYQLLAGHAVALVATDRDGQIEPDLRRIGPFLYLRLRRPDYQDADLARWASRLEPFLADGLDAFVFLRHDDDGANALRAEALLGLCAPTRDPDGTHDSATMRDGPR